MTLAIILLVVVFAAYVIHGRFNQPKQQFLESKKIDVKKKQKEDD